MNVQCPNFEELDDSFFEDNNIEVRKNNHFFIQDEEDIADEAYIKYHKIFEQKEIDYIKQVSNYDKKKSKKEIKKEIAENKKAYQNLYKIFDYEDDKEAKKGLNIIKIRLY